MKDRRGTCVNEGGGLVLSVAQTSYDTSLKRTLCSQTLSQQQAPDLCKVCEVELDQCVSDVLLLIEYANVVALLSQIHCATFPIEIHKRIIPGNSKTIEHRCFNVTVFQPSIVNLQL